MDHYTDLPNIIKINCQNKKGFGKNSIQFNFNKNAIIIVKNVFFSVCS